MVCKMTCCNDTLNPPFDGFIPPFCGFTNFTPTIPKLYWDVVSQEQRILNLFELLDKVICYADALGVQLNVNTEDIEKLKQRLDDILAEDSEFWKRFETEAFAWIDANMRELMERACKQVFFGLTDDGYFCAYVPDSWDEITFDTGAVFGRSDYGRLILRFDVDGTGVINNTYSYTLNSQPSKFEQLVKDVELNTKRTDSAFKTLFSNMDVDVVKGGENV